MSSTEHSDSESSSNSSRPSSSNSSTPSPAPPSTLMEEYPKLGSCWYLSPVPAKPLSEPVPLNDDPLDPIQFHYLADRQEFIPIVARLQGIEWGDIYKNYCGINSQEEFETYIRNHSLHKTEFECNVVATFNGEFAASAMLSNMDSPGGHAYYGVKPWLTVLVCEPSMRRKGIATRLMNRLAELARQWGFAHIWLYAEKPHLVAMYIKNGWKPIERLNCWGHVFTAMRRDFEPVLPDEEAEPATPMVAASTATPSAGAVASESA